MFAVALSGHALVHRKCPLWGKADQDVGRKKKAAPGECQGAAQVVNELVRSDYGRSRPRPLKRTPSSLHAIIGLAYSQPYGHGATVDKNAQLEPTEDRLRSDAVT